MSKSPNPYRLEAQIEKYFYNAIKKLGGECLKWQSSHKAGLPDRLVFYKGSFCMVELKTEKGKLSSGQIEMHERFKKQGFHVYVLYGIEQVKDFIQKLKSGVLNSAPLEF